MGTDPDGGPLSGRGGVIMDRDPGATERLTDKAGEILAAKQAEAAGEKKEAAPARAATAEERIVENLVKGKNVGLAEDVMDCFRRYGTAVQVIEGPLMDGMEKVGELFGAGKMFLPQVVKSARTMRDAVAILEPYMEAGESESSSSSKPKIVIATVKGDVHDIGKNITSIVLGCNGFEMTDLGVMVDKETILGEAERIGADIVAVSGLITPSLYQMEELCREMTARGMDKPLLIGGATTSALHTAVKLAPLYDHVFYGPDASASAVMAKRCMIDREAFEQEEHAAQAKLRALYDKGARKGAPDAEPNRYPAASFLRKEDSRLEDLPATVIEPEKVMPFFDWQMFLAIWGIRYGKADMNDPEIAGIMAEAKEMLGERYIAMRYLARFDWIPESVRAPLFQLLSQLIPAGGERKFHARAKRFLQGAAQSGAARYLGMVSHTDELLKKSFCGDFFEGIRPTLEQFDPEHYLEKSDDYSEFDFHTYLPGDILTKADLASMSASLELRSPFLDWHVIEFAAQLPDHYKEHRGFRKKILCDTFAKYLPPGLNHRKKRGFGVPLADWFRKEWKSLPQERLLQGKGVQQGIFSQTGLKKLIAGHLAGKDHSYALYSALVLEMFLDDP